MPGVLILEGMVQTCGILARLLETETRTGNAHKEGGRLGLLSSVKSARFRQLVRPGALLQYRASLEVRVGSLYSFKVVAVVDDSEVADAQVCLSIEEQ